MTKRDGGEGDGRTDPDETIRVAFVCVQNAGRSQMAAEFAARELTRRGLGDRVELLSGGTRPADRIHPVVVDAMAEAAIDLSGRTPREIARDELGEADIVITMGCSAEAVCPATWRGDARDWALDDPAEEDLETVRGIRDEIEGRVAALFDELEERSRGEGGRAAFETDGGFDCRDPDRGDDLEPAAQRAVVRERYAEVAAGGSEADASAGGCCGEREAGTVTETETETESGATPCCDGSIDGIGYSPAELEAAPSGTNLGLGCGNPNAIASIEAGETVLDLGSGAGFDCFLAAREVGDSGRVIGVDMTPAMVERARERAAEAKAETVSGNDAEPASEDGAVLEGVVEFRLGEIEHLPVADGSVDVVISNCVVNLSPDKPRVFREAYRVLRPGGRLAIADVVLTADLPAELRGDPGEVAGCVAGAATIDALEAMLDDAGFVDVAIESRDGSAEFIRTWSEDRDPSEFLASADITARKPDSGARE